MLCACFKDIWLIKEGELGAEIRGAEELSVKLKNMVLKDYTGGDCL